MDVGTWQKMDSCPSIHRFENEERIRQIPLDDLPSTKMISGIMKILFLKWGHTLVDIGEIAIIAVASALEYAKTTEQMENMCDAAFSVISMINDTGTIQGHCVRWLSVDELGIFIPDEVSSEWLHLAWEEEDIDSSSTASSSSSSSGVDDSEKIDREVGSSLRFENVSLLYARLSDKIRTLGETVPKISFRSRSFSVQHGYVIREEIATCLQRGVDIVSDHCRTDPTLITHSESPLCMYSCLTLFPTSKSARSKICSVNSCIDICCGLLKIIKCPPISMYYSTVDPTTTPMPSDYAWRTLWNSWLGHAIIPGLSEGVFAKFTSLRRGIVQLDLCMIDDNEGKVIDTRSVYLEGNGEFFVIHPLWANRSIGDSVIGQISVDEINPIGVLGEAFSKATASSDDSL